MLPMPDADPPRGNELEARNSNNSYTRDRTASPEPVITDPVEAGPTQGVPIRNPRRLIPNRHKNAHFSTADDVNGHVIQPLGKRVGTNDTAQTKDSSIYDQWWAPQYVLSLDGGGVRGYSSLLILRELMSIIERLEKAHEDPADSSLHPYKLPSSQDAATAQTVVNSAPPSKFSPCHYFDYIFGTSTGGLSAIMLSRLRMNVDECLAEYDVLAGDVFGNSRFAHMRTPFWWPQGKYDHKRLESAVKGVVEAQRRKNAAQNPRTAADEQLGGKIFKSFEGMCRTVCVAYGKMADGVEEKPFLFRSYEHLPTNPGHPLERNPGPAHAIPITQVARATSAAPTYFDPVEIDGRLFGDGGFGCNNPSWEGYHEVKLMHSGRSDAVALLLSVGTGKSEVSRYATGKWSQQYGFFKAAKKLASDSEGTHEAMCGLSDQHMGFPYYRFNVEKGLSEMKLDEWKKAKRGKPSTMEYLTSTTERYLEGLMEDKCTPVRDHLEKVARVLVQARRDRAATARWEMVALGIRYRCPERLCNNGQKVRDTSADLWQHLRRKHGKVGPNEGTEADRADIQRIIQLGRIVP